MRRIFRGAIGLILFSSAALAQAENDHLLCYQLPNPRPVKAAMDIHTAQLEFARRGCKIIRPVEFCVPGTKTGVEPPHPPKPGQPLKDDYICYAVECSSPSPPKKKVVVDQFGQREVSFGAPTKMCAPAHKQTETASCQVGAGGQCGGACPEPTDQCVLVEGTKPPVCRCKPR